MKRTNKNARFLAVLIAICLCASQAEAQQKLRAISNAQSSQNSVSHSTVTAPSYQLSQNKGKIILSDGKHETVVSNDPNATQPIMNGHEVYFIKKGNKLSGATICVYDINNKSTTDALKENAEDAHFSFKDEITKMILDKNSNRIFFSTVSVNQRGYSDYVTWNYDISTKKLVPYKDGEIESIDNAGNQSIAFHGVDRNGVYVSRSIVGNDGKLQKVNSKEYSENKIYNGTSVNK